MAYSSSVPFLSASITFEQKCKFLCGGNKALWEELMILTSFKCFNVYREDSKMFNLCNFHYKKLTLR
jgi:hypothetical protein